MYPRAGWSHLVATRITGHGITAPHHLHPATRGSPRHTGRVSQPQPELRVLLEDGPHAGQTISVEPDDEGQPPERITVHIPGEVLQVRQKPADAGGSEDPSDSYQRHGSDEELGLWVYQHLAD